MKSELIGTTKLDCIFANVRSNRTDNGILHNIVGTWRAVCRCAPTLCAGECHEVFFFRSSHTLSIRTAGLDHCCPSCTSRFLYKNSNENWMHYFARIYTKNNKNLYATTQKYSPLNDIPRKISIEINIQTKSLDGVNLYSSTVGLWMTENRISFSQILSNTLCTLSPLTCRGKCLKRIATDCGCIPPLISASTCKYF